MTTYYVQHGETGPAVILVHGVGLDHRMWDEHAARLAGAGQRVVRYDLLGHGQTPALERDVQIADFTAQLDALLAKLRIGAAVLVGFSLGALIARAYAVRYAGRLSHLVLLNSVYARTAQQRDAVRERYLEASRHGLSALIDAALERWFSDDFARTRPEVLERVRERLSSNQPHGFLPAYRLFAEAEDETAAQLHTIRVPTLVITGDGDVGSTPAMSAQLAQCIPRAQLLVVEGAKHMLPVERAAWLCDTLHAFIDDND